MQIESYCSGIEALQKLQQALSTTETNPPSRIDDLFQDMMVLFLANSMEAQDLVYALCAERVDEHLSSLRLIHCLNQNWDKSQMLRSIDGNSAYDVLDRNRRSGNPKNPTSRSLSSDVSNKQSGSNLPVSERQQAENAANTPPRSADGVSSKEQEKNQNELEAIVSSVKWFFDSAPVLKEHKKILLEDLAFVEHSLRSFCYDTCSETYYDICRDDLMPQTVFQRWFFQKIILIVGKMPFNKGIADQYPFPLLLENIANLIDSEMESPESAAERSKWHYLKCIMDILLWQYDVQTNSSSSMKTTVSDHHWCLPYFYEVFQEDSSDSVGQRLKRIKKNILENQKSYADPLDMQKPDLIELIECMEALFTDPPFSNLSQAIPEIIAGLKDYVSTAYYYTMSKVELDAASDYFSNVFDEITRDIFEARIISLLLFLHCVYYAEALANPRKTAPLEPPTSYSLLKCNDSIFGRRDGRYDKIRQERAKACEDLYLRIHAAIAAASYSNLASIAPETWNGLSPILPFLSNAKCNLFQFLPTYRPLVIADAIVKNLGLPKKVIAEVLEVLNCYMRLDTAFRYQKQEKAGLKQEVFGKPYRDYIDALRVITNPKHILPFLFKGEISKMLEEAINTLFGLIQHYYKTESAEIGNDTKASNEFSIQDKYMCITKRFSLNLTDCNMPLYWAITQYTPDQCTPDILKHPLDDLIAELVFEDLAEELNKYRAMLSQELNHAPFTDRQTDFRILQKNRKAWSLDTTDAFLSQLPNVRDPHIFISFLKDHWKIGVSQKDTNRSFLLGAYDECADLCKKTIYEGIYQALTSYLNVCYPLRLSDGKGKKVCHSPKTKSSGKRQALKKGTE